VAVDSGVLAGEIGSIQAVNEYGAVGVVLTVEQMVQIGEVILGVGDGVIDNGVGAVYPTGGLGVLSLESRKVNADGGDFHFFLLGLLSVGGGGLGSGLGGGDILLAHCVIIFLSDLVAIECTDDFIGAESEYAQEDQA